MSNSGRPCVVVTFVGDYEVVMRCHELSCVAVSAHGSANEDMAVTRSCHECS